MEMLCPYCGNKAEFTTSTKFYGTNYGSNVYFCKPCDARVGTHGKGTRPLGTLANKELRRLRGICHSLLDPYWRRGRYSRTTCYIRMAKAMNLDSKDAHIGMFNEQQCKQLINLFGRSDLI